MSDTLKTNRAQRPNRSVARLCAVQALYALRVGDQKRSDVLADFRLHRIPEITGDKGFKAPDEEFFVSLVESAEDHADELDGLISAVLAEDWPLERLETLLHMLFRAAAYELAWRLDIPAKVVINEYVDLAHAFFSEGEPGMVNGILDRLSRELRPEEVGGNDPR